MKFLKEYWYIVLLVAILICAISLLGVTIAKSVQQEKEYNAWYNSLSPEEQAKEQARIAAKREERIQRYEVFSVSQYVRNETNQFGAITDTDICYAFSYIAGNNLQHVDGFEHLDYGLTKVIIGDKDMYIVDTNGADTHRYLQLTKETLKNIKISN